MLGLVPGGRGNDLARVLGIPDDPEGACAIIAEGHTRAVDLGVVADGARRRGRARRSSASPRPASTATPTGSPTRRPSWLGGLVYAYGAMRALISWTPARFEVELDPPGERHVFTGYSVAAANSRAYGGGMMLAPGAMLDDGMLDVIAIERVSKARFLANLPKVFGGKHVDEPTVRVFRAREVSIGANRPFTLFADGDPIGELPVRVSALAGAITMIVPPPDPHPPFAAPSPAPAEPGDPPAASLMAGPSAAKLALARGVGALSRMRGGGATSAPGKVLMRLAPDAVGELGSRLAQGSALISATNGKTTTAAMAASVLEHHGLRLVHNQAGANMAGGIATTLLGAARRGGRMDGELGLFEVDELWLAGLASRAASAGDPAGQPVPRPARPLRRARDDRRKLGAGRG